MPDPWAFGWDQVAAFLNVTVIGFAAWVAWRGVRDWREERLDARQSEVAEQAMILAYQAREVFDRIRSPGSFAGEGSSRKPEVEEAPEEKEARDSAFVPIERIRNEARFFEQVLEIRPRIDALFGKGQAEPFDEFLKLRGEIIGAARSLSRLNQRTDFSTQEQRDDHLDRLGLHEEVIWSCHGGDRIDKRLVSAVESIERLAAPVLESRLRPQKAT
jgi:hypothetical protein